MVLENAFAAPLLVKVEEAQHGPLHVLDCILGHLPPLLKHNTVDPFKRFTAGSKEEGVVAKDIPVLFTKQSR
eukprot:9483700-Pyramimonas_sp.AAC.1